MKNKRAGIICILLGAVLICSALLLFAYNQLEDRQAGASSNAALLNMHQAMEQQIKKEDPPKKITQDSPEKIEQPDKIVPVKQIQEPSVITIDGHDYIGYLSIPALSLELPVMEECTYPGLRISPCRQFGSAASDDLVIAAHNYKRHFGNLKLLNEGDTITFTDAANHVYTYSVAGVAIMEPTSVEEVRSYDDGMVLYTCTYGGKSRVVVTCKRVRPDKFDLLTQ